LLAARNSTARRQIRYLAGFVATFCLLGQLSSIAHNLFVQHATCAEHGELIHPQGGIDHSPVEAGADATVAGEVAETRDSHEHDHCLAVAHGRGHVGLDAAVAALTSAPAAPAIVSDDTAAPGPVSRALYRLAPKNSPPA